MENIGVINYAVYEDGKRFLGIAKITMPNKEAKTFTVNGAGINGDIDIPVIGTRNAMKMTIEFQDMNEAAYVLAEERVHLLDLKVIHQSLDYSGRTVGDENHKYVVKVMPISFSGGDLEPAKPQGVSGEFSVLSIKEYINGKCVSEIDPLNFVDIDHTGKNRLASIKTGLGL